MRYTVVSDIPGRLRLKLHSGFLCEGEVYGIESFLCAIGGVRSAIVHLANGSVLVYCDASPSVRADVLAAVDNLDVLNLPMAGLLVSNPNLPLSRKMTDSNWRLPTFLCGVCCVVCCRFPSVPP